MEKANIIIPYVGVKLVGFRFTGNHTGSWSNVRICDLISVPSINIRNIDTFPVSRARLSSRRDVGIWGGWISNWILRIYNGVVYVTISTTHDKNEIFDRSKIYYEGISSRGRWFKHFYHVFTRFKDYFTLGHKILIPFSRHSLLNQIAKKCLLPRRLSSLGCASAINILI